MRVGLFTPGVERCPWKFFSKNSEKGVGAFCPIAGIKISRPCLQEAQCVTNSIYSAGKNLLRGGGCPIILRGA